MIADAVKQQVLDCYPMLRELPAATLADLMASATHMTVPAGAMMFDERQPCMGFPLLLSGSTRVIPFREHVFSRFSERLSDLLELVAAVTFQKLDQRLARALAARPSPIRTTHQALADELGSLREIVSRLLKNFADQGWVQLGREQIDVIGAPAPSRLATL